MNRWIVLSLWLFPLVGHAYPVGCRTLTFTDPERDRTLPTEICFPAHVPRKIVARPPQAFHRKSFLGASIRPSLKPYPLLILSHGTGGHAGSLAWFSEYFAAKGFIVVTPHHPGSTFGDVRAEQLYQNWNRPRDISFVLDELEKLSPYRHWYDPAQIVMAGFSMGGYTTLAMAGARFSIRRFDRFCIATRFQTEDCRMIENVNRETLSETRDDENWRDGRIRAFFAMSPFGGQGMETASLRTLTVPVYLLGLTQDEVLPFSQNAKYVFSFLPKAELSEIHTGRHYALLGLCTKEGFEWVPELCQGESPEVRDAIHSLVKARAERFFRGSGISFPR